MKRIYLGAVFVIILSLFVACGRGEIIDDNPNNSIDVRQPIYKEPDSNGYTKDEDTNDCVNDGIASKNTTAHNIDLEELARFIVNARQRYWEVISDLGHERDYLFEHGVASTRVWDDSWEMYFQFDYVAEKINTLEKFISYLNDYFTFETIMLIKEGRNIIEVNGVLVAVVMNGANRLAFESLSIVSITHEQEGIMIVSILVPSAFEDDPEFEFHLRMIHANEEVWLIDLDSWSDLL